MTNSGRFDAFVWVSGGLHLFVAAVVLAWALSAPRPKPPATLFELVGNPPRGNGGGDIRSTPREPVSPASETPESPTPVAPSPLPPEKAVSNPTPTSPPDRTSPKLLSKSVPTAATKTPTGPGASKASPATGKAKTESVNSAAAGSASGTHPGAPGRPDGDTLSVSSGQGLPSPMGMWLSRVKYQVERNWRAPDGLAGVTQMPEVVFQVARDGRSSRVQLKTKSGNPTLDRLALRAVQAVESFPPVPDVWLEDRVVVRYVLQYASQ